MNKDLSHFAFFAACASFLLSAIVFFSYRVPVQPGIHTMVEYVNNQDSVIVLHYEITNLKELRNKVLDRKSQPAFHIDTVSGIIDTTYYLYITQGEIVYQVQANAKYSKFK